MNQYRVFDSSGKFLFYVSASDWAEALSFARQADHAAYRVELVTEH